MGKGVVWVNGHCLGCYWNIGSTQSMYLPAPFLNIGINKVLVLDLIGPEEASLKGLDQPILNELHSEKDFSRSARPKVTFNVSQLKPNHKTQFAAGDKMQTIKFSAIGKGRYFCFEALSSFDGKPSAAIAEMDILDAKGQPISHQNWTIAYVSSEELIKENGSAENAIDGQTFNFWHSEWSNQQPAFPHYLVIDLGKEETVTGFRYVPHADSKSPGRIKEYQIFVENDLIKK